MPKNTAGRPEPVNVDPGRFLESPLRFFYVSVSKRFILRNSLKRTSGLLEPLLVAGTGLALGVAVDVERRVSYRKDAPKSELLGVAALSRRLYRQRCRKTPGLSGSVCPSPSGSSIYIVAM